MARQKELHSGVGPGHSHTYVERLPECSFHPGIAAHYDGKTREGPWAYMCDLCFQSRGRGLGLGKGQRMIVRATTMPAGAGAGSGSWDRL